MAAQVRHEAAEALGAIGDSECVEFLRRFEGAEAEMLRESCQVRSVWAFLVTTTTKVVTNAGPCLAGGPRCC